MVVVVTASILMIAGPLLRFLGVTIVAMLPLAALYAIMLGFHHNGSVIQFLIAVEPHGHKLNGYFIIESPHELFTPLSISGHIIRSIARQLIEKITIIFHSV